MGIDANNVVAAQRLGMGARPGELETIGSDPVGWALAQMAKDDPGPRIQSGHERLSAFIAGRQAANEAKKSGDTDAEKTFNGQLRDMFVADVSSRALYAGLTPTPFRERLVWFWSNHFTVSLSRDFERPLAVPFENEAIRPHVNGKFLDMLRAVVMHPAMLLYLDNAESIGPNSFVGLRNKKGLNENLARELMELHTLGVDGGYTQTDVTNLAKILTGWTVENEAASKTAARFGAQTDGKGFMYLDVWHEPGGKDLLGRTYNGGGMSEGYAALLALANSEATANHIARKLAVHFVSDDPPKTVVARWARLFYTSGGDLELLNADIVRTPEVWQNAGSKARTPQDFVTAALRGLGVAPNLFEVRPGFAGMIVNSYNQLGQPAFNAPSPAGWSDMSRDWISGSGVKSRIDWALALSGRVGKLFDPVEFADYTVGPILSQQSLSAIRGAPSKPEGLALALVSPEFMRR